MTPVFGNPMMRCWPRKMVLFIIYFLTWNTFMSIILYIVLSCKLIVCLMWHIGGSGLQSTRWFNLILMFSRMAKQESTIVMVQFSIEQMIYYSKIYVLLKSKHTRVYCSRCAVQYNQGTRSGYLGQWFLRKSIQRSACWTSCVEESADMRVLWCYKVSKWRSWVLMHARKS